MIDFKRQVAMFDPSKHEAVHAVIVGCGNIGSHTALALVRMGVKRFTLVDFDTVEGHNLSSQAYSWRDKDKYKVDCLEQHILAISPNTQVKKVYKAYQNAGLSLANEVVISAVDSMQTRREICEMLPLDMFVIDGRMGGGQIEVHAQKVSEWGETLKVEGDADPCGARYISYTSYIIAGLIANTLKRYLQGERYASRTLMHTNTLEIIKTMV
jgi:cell division GTPase FtsZ